MIKSGAALLKNAWRAHVSHESYLEPLMAVFYVTKLCNYSCSYCPEFGADKNAKYKKEQMSTEEVIQTLSIIRQGCEAVYFTGGEPTLRNDLVEVVRAAKHDLGFAITAMNTNGFVLPKREAVLEHLDAVVISLDSMDTAKADAIYKMPAGSTAKVIDILKRYAKQKRRLGFELVVSCVVGPDNIEDANDVFDFCLDHDLEFSIQVLEVGWSGPHPELRKNPGFQALVERAIREKRKNSESVSGSMPYLEGLRQMQPFDCYPTTNPRIDSLGRLYWPCHPLYMDQQGGLIDLREHGSWDAAIEYARAKFGDPPRGCQKCYLRCYAEFSLLIEQPSRMAQTLLEKLSKALVYRSGLGVYWGRPTRTHPSAPRSYRTKIASPPPPAAE